jgi:UDP-glucose 4-epimerase
MKVFITGGAGFIGSHLADAYLAQGGQVSILDNLSTGSLVNIEQIKIGFRSIKEILET